MSRKSRAILIATVLPIAITIVFYIVTLFLQPAPVSISNSPDGLIPTYLSTGSVSYLAGDLEIYRKEILTPEEIDALSKTSGFTPEHATIKGNSFHAFKSPENKVGNRFIFTLHFYFKVPANDEYALLMPTVYPEYRVFINGELAGASDKFDSENAYYPGIDKVYFPISEDGKYDVVINYISPDNYSFLSSSALIFGAKEPIERRFNTSVSTDLGMSAFIVVCIAFCIVQYIFVRKDKILISFVLFSLAFVTCVLFLHDSYTDFVVTHLPYQAGMILRGFSTPLFFASLLYHTDCLFPNYIKKPFLNIGLAIQIVPLINALTLEMFPFFIGISALTTLFTFLFCVWVFIKAYENREKYIGMYIFSISMLIADVALMYLTAGMVCPSKYIYVWGYILTAAVLVISLSMRYSEQSAAESFYKEELARQLENMQANENAFLNAQMKPHFLYNTLNTIADLCVTDPKKAKHLIGSLSDFLKLVLSVDNMEETVTLRRELELVNAYTDIESERFPSIKFFQDFPIRMPNIMMPPIVIQPLIENAIKHGVRRLDKPGLVTLKIIDDADSVTFEVSDNGTGMTEEQMHKLFMEPKENNSIGIYNINKRLNNQYGTGLQVDSAIGLGTCVRFTIPKN
jgi:hypothetical protein